MTMRCIGGAVAASVASRAACVCPSACSCASSSSCCCSDTDSGERVAAELRRRRARERERAHQRQQRADAGACCSCRACAAPVLAALVAALLLSALYWFGAFTPRPVDTETSVAQLLALPHRGTELLESILYSNQRQSLQETRRHISNCMYE